MYIYIYIYIYICIYIYIYMEIATQSRDKLEGALEREKMSMLSP